MTTKELSKISGITVRTLHYYDKIGLLVPTRNENNEYREYSQDDLNMLHQILLFKECGFSLGKIKKLIRDKDFDKKKAYILQKEILEKEKTHINNMIKTIEKSIKELNGETTMNNKEKFKVFKENLINENEVKYGEEIREKYGKEQTERFNENIRNLNKADFDRLEELNINIKRLIDKLMMKDNVELEKQLADVHKEWLILNWGNAVAYSKEVHLNLCEMYLSDERFTSYYGGTKQVEVIKKSVENHL